jgi:hypothetical protein
LIEDVQNDPDSIKSSWTTIEEQNQIELLQKVKLPSEVIAKYWKELDDQFRFLCCRLQEIDTGHLAAWWGDLDIASKYTIVKFQPRVPQDLIDDFWKEMSKHGEATVNAFAESVSPERRPGVTSSGKDSEKESSSSDGEETDTY